ncbi:ferritin-like domain-containing protein [Viridibacillus sp. FSL R5-0477]|uniref:Uncharacterized protein n=1 Tax=Viridibacillus arenosi FSL R5-213 TaxID=1227360 RepID=W4F0A3_9BACL|nr:MULTISPECIES: ferritin-like domain-containing protein [Viridibacillus]ETT86220.1 hypothetical protein C176_05897 [Viridibacillus arenosi FSL R5-213]OMC84875.1 rubrerythrin family protein [Viridibacillus sp. FSL H8-0123]OMC85781.1 rubrerythrin family protein [Viridibacillus sp. FSL H7-0596]OMC91924.1 rubrerythrin family protein [Viridibacillus arenosi]
MNYNSLQQQLPNKLITDIAKAIDGEFTAIRCYEVLSKQSPNKEIRDRILEIRSDEMRHFQIFSQIYFSLTGTQYTPKMNVNCPTNYRSGILHAFKDEQETVDFYHEVAREANNTFIQQQFMQASFDEQNHAVWFLYFMNNS